LFFQAEDGIRGFHVTGVQTCALPISLFEASTIEIEGLEPALLDRDPAILDATAAAIRTIGWAAIPQLQRLLRHENWMVRRGAARSEERRVGKERSSGRAAIQSNAVYA